MKLKKENNCEFFRFKELKTAPTYKPDLPKMHTISIKAKNVSKALMDDLTKKKEVKKY